MGDGRVGFEDGGEADGGAQRIGGSVDHLDECLRCLRVVSHSGEGAVAHDGQAMTPEIEAPARNVSAWL